MFCSNMFPNLFWAQYVLGQHELFVPYTRLKVSTKYAFAERLGNMIDPLKIPKELLSLRTGFFWCASGDLWEALNIDLNSAYQYYQDFCLDTSYPDKGCKVNLG